MPKHKMPDSNCPDFPGECECKIPYAVRVHRVQVAEIVILAVDQNAAARIAMDIEYLPWDTEEQRVDQVLREHKDGHLIQEQLTDGS